MRLLFSLNVRDFVLQVFGIVELHTAVCVCVWLYVCVTITYSRLGSTGMVATPGRGQVSREILNIPVLVRA